MNDLKKLYELYLENPVVTTDSRRIEPGCLFFALRGPHFNGNSFALNALKAGARLAIIDDPASYLDADRTLLVDDSLKALQQLALHHRRQLELPVVAIAGSNGKTTTKELIHSILRQRYKCHATPGNLNNYIGLPLTLLQMPVDTEIAVIELGANQQGEIAELCTLCEPTHGLVTNIGKDHLEGFGGPEGVRRANQELFDYLQKKGGVAFVNADEPELADMAASLKRVVYYHQSVSLDPAHPPLEMKLLQSTPLLQTGFLDEKKELCTLSSNLYGLYNFNNIMTAVAVGRYFKVKSSDIKKGVESYIPASNRSELIKEGTNLFILDAYNANPSSMHLALESLRILNGFAHKMVVLGEMKELGIYSTEEHLHILEKVKEYGFMPALFLGGGFAQLKTSFPDFHFFDSLEALHAYWNTLMLSDTVVLFKGSRANRLEKLLKE